MDKSWLTSLLPLFIVIHCANVWADSPALQGTSMPQNLSTRSPSPTVKVEACIEVDSNRAYPTPAGEKAGHNFADFLEQHKDAFIPQALYVAFWGNQTESQLKQRISGYRYPMNDLILETNSEEHKQLALALGVELSSHISTAHYFVARYDCGITISTLLSPALLPVLCPDEGSHAAGCVYECKATGCVKEAVPKF